MTVTVTAAVVAAASATVNASIALSCFLLAAGLLIHSAAANQLRPSDHGLEHQLPPPAGETSPPAMMSFFGASALKSPPPPISMNYSTDDDGSWLRSGRGDGRNRVREILLVASLVCGISGVALLLASGLVFLFKFRKGRRSESTVNDAPTSPLPPEIDHIK